jgi:hypothetical protein
MKQDVKESAPSSETETQTQSMDASDSEETSSKEASAEDLEDSDLQELEEAKKIPYSRFKQVNEEKKALMAQAQELEQRFKESEFRRIAIEEQAREAARLREEIQTKQDDDLDPWDRNSKKLESYIAKLEAKVSRLESQTENVSQEAEWERLSKKYPEADKLAVKGWKVASPTRSLEELAEMSHNSNVDRAQKQLKELLEKKKQRAKSALPTVEAGIRLKDSEKPKSSKEATALIRRMFSK